MLRKTTLITFASFSKLRDDAIWLEERIPLKKWHSMTLTLILKVLLIAAMAATLCTLIMGLFTLFKAGHEADERSNRMMRLRILFQALAILFFSLLLFLKGK